MAERRRCKAMLTHGSRRCRNAPILGSSVCRYHGGGAPQVRAAARDRLEALALPAIDGLKVALDSGDLQATCRAAIAVLDRTGFHRGVDLHFQAVGEAHALADVLVAVISDALSALELDHGDHAIRAAVADALRRRDNGSPVRPRKQPRREPEVMTL